MNYYLDTEFIESWKKPIKWLPTIGNFNKPYHSIQLISIGIVCEDGRTYYAISKEYNYDDASDWVKKNVILPMYQELTPAHKQFSGENNFHKYEGKTNRQIAKEILQFVAPYHFLSVKYKTGNVVLNQETYLKQFPAKFFAFFADYDWVLFCSLFGSMNDLPKGFPWYCRDLKQMLDEIVAETSCKDLGIYMTETIPVRDDVISFEQKLALVQGFTKYPKQANEHNALDDAKFDKALHEFITSIKQRRIGPTW